jgi:hypothetical protein
VERKDFLKMGCCGLIALAARPGFAESSSATVTEGSPCDDGEFKFVKNWLTDLMEAIDGELDESDKIKLMSACGRGCYQRFQFKQDIATKGKGSVDKLIEAYKANFEIWREGDNKVHIRYGAVNKNGCFCPAAKFRPSKSNDIQCYCTRATHETIWQTALSKPIKIDILQTVRRGDPTCHFLVHLA